MKPGVKGLFFFSLLSTPTAFAFDVYTPLLGPAKTDTIRYSPQYHIPYQDNGLSPAGINPALEKQRLAYIAFSAALLAKKGVPASSIKGFTNYGTKMVSTPNEIGHEIDLAYGIVSRHFQACHWWGGSPTTIAVNVQPGIFYACHTVAGCAWLGGEADWGGHWIIAAAVYMGGLGNPKHAYADPFQAIAWWEMGNAVASQNDYHPNSVQQEIGSISPCGLPNARARAMNLVMYQGRPIPVRLSAVNFNHDPLTYRIVQKPVHGKLLGNPPNLIYYPNRPFHGVDHLTFVADAGLYASSARVTLRVLDVRDPPVVANESVTLMANTSAKVELSARDRYNEPLKYQILRKPAHGKLKGKAPDLVYTADSDYVGEDHFTFRVLDDSAYAAGTVKIEVIDPKGPPAPTRLKLTSSAPGLWTADWKSADGTTVGFYVAFSDNGVVPSCKSGREIKKGTMMNHRSKVDAHVTVSVCAANYVGKISSQVSAVPED